MSERFYFTSLFSLIFSFLLVSFVQPQKDDYKKSIGYPTPAMMNGVIVLKFKGNLEILNHENLQTTDIAFNKLLKQHRISRIEAVFPKVASSGLVKAEEMAKLHYLKFSHNTSPQIIADDFTALRVVAYAEPKYLSYPDDVPNDPQYLTQEYFNAVMNSEAAWDIAKVDSGDVTIAIIDSGTDWQHEDLIGNMWKNPNEIEGNGIDDDENGFIDDIHGWNFAKNNNDPRANGESTHGTHVAGIAGASTNNNKGIASISWNPQIMALNVAETGELMAFGYEAVGYATMAKVDIINCSWGRYEIPSLFEEEVVDFATANNALVIASAGNGGSDSVGDSTDETPHFPSNYANVLSVGATLSNSDRIAPYSNYGLTVDVFAPGSGILSTLPNNSYGFMNGTSMATPVVSGLATLIKSQHPEWTPHQLRTQIRTTCDPIDDANSSFYTGILGSGRINPLKAVTENLPAIRLHSYFVLDSGNDGEIDPGESIELFLTFTNDHQAANQVKILLSTNNPDIELINDSKVIGIIETNQLISVKFTFEVDSDTPYDQKILFKADISNEDYHDYNLLTLTTTPPKIVVHDTGPLRTSVSDLGTIGFIDASDGILGQGFYWNNQNLLYEGSLMLATGIEQVSDCLKNLSEVQNKDFRAIRGNSLQLNSPGENHFQESAVELVDSLADNPIGVSILQESFADTSSVKQNYVMMKYTLKNETPDTIDNLYIALFFDWDVGEDILDYGRLDESRRLAYTYNTVDDTSYIGATKMLSSDVGFSYRTIHNPNEIYDGFTASEKWEFMTGGIQTQELDGVEISTISSAGPFKIAPNETTEVGFAIIGANDIKELTTAADHAQEAWDNMGIISSVEEVFSSKPKNLRFFPNPFHDDLQISYELKQNEKVRVSLFSIEGQRIEILSETFQNAGIHQFSWNSSNDIPAGTYLLQLQIGRQVLTKKVVKL